MPQSLSQLYVHLIFSTKNREPLLLLPIRERMHAYLATVFKNQDKKHTIGSRAFKTNIESFCNATGLNTTNDTCGIKGLAGGPPSQGLTNPRARNPGRWPGLC